MIRSPQGPREWLSGAAGNVSRSSRPVGLAVLLLVAIIGELFLATSFLISADRALVRDGTVLWLFAIFQICLLGPIAYLFWRRVKLQIHKQRDRLESYRVGVNSYIVKPVEFDSFVRAMADAGLYWMLLNKPVEAPVP